MIQTAQSTAGFLHSLMAIIPPKSSARIILGEMILTVTKESTSKLYFFNFVIAGPDTGRNSR